MNNRTLHPKHSTLQLINLPQRYVLLFRCLRNQVVNLHQGLLQFVSPSYGALVECVQVVALPASAIATYVTVPPL